MHIGSGVFLLVLGAILSWGVADRVSGVNLHVIGLICMAGGVLAILFSLVTGSRSRGYGHPHRDRRQGDRHHGRAGRRRVLTRHTDPLDIPTHSTY